MAVFSLRAHMVFPLCVSVPLFILKVYDHVGLGPIPVATFNIITSFKDLVSKCSHILRCCGLGLHHKNVEVGHNLGPHKQTNRTFEKL